MFTSQANPNCLYIELVSVQTKNCFWFCKIILLKLVYNVIDLDWQCKKTLFLGRCARAGRRGTAFSLVSTDDEAHLLDLYLFLNRTFDTNKATEIGTIPPDVLEDEHEAVLKWLTNQHIVSKIQIKFKSKHRGLLIFLF